MKLNKKLYLLMLIPFLFVATACNRNNQLLILNWGEYINDEVVVEFEKQTGYEVVISIADSNELFYSKIKSGTTAYDLVVPSDYMLEKMVQKDLVQKIDYSKLSNYDPINNPFMEGVLGIQSEMFEGNEDYGVPYFWGTFGLMYTLEKEGLQQAVLENSWKTLFEDNMRPNGTRVGMYNVSRYAYAVSNIYNGFSPNEINNDLIDLAFNTLIKTDFTEWGFDTLKKGIVANNLDLAFVYTGDFLDMLYTKMDDGYSLEEINFDIYIPDDTIAFMDFLVIPKKARHVNIAHEFINFMLEPDNAYNNASVVGYATPLQNAYDRIVNHLGDEDSWLNSWAYANLTYYPTPKETDIIKYKGTPLANFEQSWLDKINTMVNNVKAN